MKLICLGSGSSGNCYILNGGTEALIIEAGLPFMAVKKALDFNIRKIVGVVSSHRHLDHSKFAGEYEKAGIPVFKPYLMTDIVPILFGKFAITAFKLVHDVPCYGFYIYHEETGSVVYASDTEYIKHLFVRDYRANHILVEANYSTELIDPAAVNRNHVLTGHMSLQTTLDFLAANDSPELMNVVLCHLSQDNADPDQFREAAKKVVSCPVWVAQPGLVVELRKEPF